MGFDIRMLRDKRVIPVLEAALKGVDAHWEGEYQLTLRADTAYVSLRTAPLVDGQGNIQGGIGIVVDLSEQKRAETEKSRFMSAIEQATETIVITDTQGSIEYVNPAFEAMTGYTAKEVQGKNPRILKSGRHDTQFYRDMWDTLVSGRVWKGHIVNRKKDGSLFEEDVTISPVRNQEGRVTNYVAVKRDVTEEMALKKQLNQAMKMEAIGTLAGGIAHDFNNILSAVLGYAEMVDIQLAEDDPAREDVAQIIIAGHRATDLIRQILTFSRQEEEELRPVKLQFIIKEALKLLRSSLPSSIELHQDIDSNCGSVLADPTSVHQVLINLCTNAKQALIGSSGSLSVRLGEVDDESASMPALPETMRGQRWVVLTVSDTGCGMDDQVRERIFDPFFTTKKQGQGTGLGLSVVHGIVKSHGGEILVESEPGRGTNFHVLFPLVNAEEQVQEYDCTQEVVGGTERILLVDDEPFLVDLMGRSLRLLGYQVESFTDSAAALAWLKEHDGDIDLVITDMTMPGITGAQLAEAVLARNPAMPIILCTGYSEEMDAQKARELGISRFVAKPVDNRELALTIREVLEAS
jgi:PAS domain S-box-containing protein